MNWLKKFWIVFVSFLPLSVGAFWPLILVGGAVSGLVGYSIYRSTVPVNLSDALSFFSSCWSCQLFSDVIAKLSYVLTATYKSLGGVIIPFAVSLTAIWFAWQILKTYIMPKGGGMVDGWAIGGKFGTHIIKVFFVAILLAVPLPRIVSSVILEPTFNIGLSMNYTLSETQARERYADCVVATAIIDSVNVNADAQNSGINAFSPRFRHNVTCQIANIHQMTGLGMTIGWTMLSMAFDHDYMHTIMFDIPIFPNIPLFLVGLLILGLYLAALLPIPLYFLEIFVKLSIDFIFLPLTFISWLFPDWKILYEKGNVKQIIDDVISGVMGLAMTGIFITFSAMVLNAVFGTWEGASALHQAIAANDSKLLMDALMESTSNKSLVTIILLGIFMAMFMVMIPALIKSLFNVSISDSYYKTAKKDLETFWSGAKKLWESGKK